MTDLRTRLPAARPQAEAAGATFRPEIQGLRALAVLAVVFYHLWPERLTGGYVGVDVFFVISGYLITSHLFRDFTRTGRVGLAAFWGRRIRRLLPASLLVLAVSCVAVYLWAPVTTWEASARQIAASALYVQNWLLAANAVDYSAMNDSATVAQHFWSLSVEEQFYVVWPLLLLALFWLAARRRSTASAEPRGPLRPTAARRVFVLGLLAVTVLSLAYSIYDTSVNQAGAYFVTPTRVWEFGAGGLAALLAGERRYSGLAATLIGWAAVCALAFSITAYSSATPFPGYTAALPVLATVALILGSGRARPDAPGWWLSRRPARFVGDISYSLYLWHWPPIVILPFILGHPLGWKTKVLILLAAIAAAWATKVVVEDPVRRGRLLRVAWRPFGFALAGGAAVVALAVVLVAVPAAFNPVAAASASGPCHGPAALIPSNACSPVTGQDASRSAVSISKEQPLCLPGFEGSELVTCSYGASPAKATKKVALVGDSHAAAWVPALDALGKKRGWQIVTYTKTSCPATMALRVLPNETTDANQSACHAWVERLNAHLKADHSISAVFTAAFSSAYTFASPAGRSLADPAIDGFRDEWAAWRAAGKDVYVFDDVPRTQGSSVPTCIAEHAADPMACAVPRAQALPPTMSITQAAADAARAHQVTHLSMRDRFCDQQWCYPQVGSVIVYRDFSHLSEEYSTALAPYIDEQLGG